MQNKNTPPKLPDQVRERIRVKHYSIRTEQLYVQWIKRFILFHGKRHPLERGAAEVEAFLKGMGSDTIISPSWVYSHLSKRRAVAPALRSVP